jgi:hypothetical protein
MRIHTALVLSWAAVAAGFLTARPAAQGRGAAGRAFASKASSSREKPLSWQESLELLLVPTTPLAQRQVLLQVSVWLVRRVL